MNVTEMQRIILDLDKIECDLHRSMRQLYNLRQKLADTWSVRDRGFVEREPERTGGS